MIRPERDKVNPNEESGFSAGDDVVRKLPDEEERMTTQADGTMTLLSNQVRDDLEAKEQEREELKMFATANVKSLVPTNETRKATTDEDKAPDSQDGTDKERLTTADQDPNSLSSNEKMTTKEQELFPSEVPMTFPSEARKHQEQRDFQAKERARAERAKAFHSSYYSSNLQDKMLYMEQGYLSHIKTEKTEKEKEFATEVPMTLPCENQDKRYFVSDGVRKLPAETLANHLSNTEYLVAKAKAIPDGDMFATEVPMTLPNDATRLDHVQLKANEREKVETGDTFLCRDGVQDERVSHHDHDNPSAKEKERAERTTFATEVPMTLRNKSMLKQEQMDRGAKLMAKSERRPLSYTGKMGCGGENDIPSDVPWKHSSECGDDGFSRLDHEEEQIKVLKCFETKQRAEGEKKDPRDSNGPRIMPLLPPKAQGGVSDLTAMVDPSDDLFKGSPSFATVRDMENNDLIMTHDSSRNMETAPSGVTFEAAVVLADSEANHPGLVDGDHEGNAFHAFIAEEDDEAVEATGVAVVMTDEEEEKLEQRRFKRYFVCACIAFIIIIVAIVIPVTSVAGNKSSETIDVETSAAPSLTPSASPSMSPTTLGVFSTIAYLVANGVSEEAAFDDRGSPQYRAADWIANRDVAALDFENPKELNQWLQRYRLATFYYATNGDNWRTCGKESESCTGGPAKLWLANKDECSWFSVRCERIPGVVNAIRFEHDSNDLEGTLPPEFFQLTDIEMIDVGKNKLHGTLSDSWGDFKKLKQVFLNYNNFSGTISESLWQSKKNLYRVLLSNNNFTGSIPESLYDVSTLEYLHLGYNALTGSFSDRFGELTSLTTLTLSGNSFTGPLPEQIGELTALTRIGLLNNTFAGRIPESLFNLTALIGLHLSGNEFTGTLSHLFGKLTGLRTLDISRNAFTGTLSERVEELLTLQKLSLSDNGFYGPIPDSLYNVSTVSFLHLAGNEFVGSLSVRVGEMSSLRSIALQDNRFFGPLPDALYDISTLADLNLTGNAFTGTLSERIGELTELTSLSLQQNNFSGPIPMAIDQLGVLKNLTIQMNMFTGSISETICFAFNVIPSVDCDQVQCPDNCCECFF